MVREQTMLLLIAAVCTTEAFTPVGLPQQKLRPLQVKIAGTLVRPLQDVQESRCVLAAMPMPTHPETALPGPLVLYMTGIKSSKWTVHVLIQIQCTCT
jgi:hypothetical protein